MDYQQAKTELQRRKDEEVPAAVAENGFTEAQLNELVYRLERGLPVDGVVPEADAGSLKPF